MNNLLTCILFFLFFAATFHSFGQQKTSGDFLNLKFPEFARMVEQKKGYRFFYKDPEMDSLGVDITSDSMSFKKLMVQLFQKTPFHFLIDSPNVYITRQQLLLTSLPENFFDHAPGLTDTASVLAQDKQDQHKNLIRSSESNRLFEIGIPVPGTKIQKAVITGYIRDGRNGELISGAAIYIDSTNMGVVSDQYGYFSLSIPIGRHSLNIFSSGMHAAVRQVLVHGDGKLNIELTEDIPSLKEIVVTTERRSNVRGLQLGVERLTVKNIKQVPVVFGEADLLKMMLTLPGVTSVGEASSGYNVRGGATDQNLILFNDQTIYNPSHLFGFFTAFNPDVIRSVELYKTAIPEKYGGRLSSVLDVGVKEGNNKKFSGTGGIGLLTSKLMLEGPLVKDKSSFILSGRSTYSNWILHALPNSAYQNSEAGFSDLDLHINHAVNTKNSVYLNAYWSNDRFRLNSDTLYQYGNLNLNAKWKHIFNSRLYHVLTTGMDQYHYDVSSSSVPVNAYRLSFDIRQFYLRSDYSYALNNKHLIDFGLNSVYYQLHPGSYQAASSQSLVTPEQLQKEQALESALYLGDQYAINHLFSVSAGIRYSLYQFLGPHKQYLYRENQPRSKSTITDTIAYAAGKIISHDGGPEFRTSLRYAISDNASIKASFNTLRQYVHMITNTTAISPTDIWKLSDPYIRPQTGNQYTIGYYRNFRSNTIETSVEIYYKRFHNYLDYKSGALLVMNHHIETDVIQTKGKAYGLELMMRKNSGRLNGWINYTYSRTFLKTDDPLTDELVNGGQYYPTGYDKPHSANLISNYQFSHRYNVSLSFVYSTGRPITLPIALFNAAGGQRVYYSERNQYRIPDYFRGDFSFTMDGNHRIKQRIHNSWSFGVYNFFARKNVYSIYFAQDNGQIKGYQLSVFGTAIPFITYNFRF